MRPVSVPLSIERSFAAECGAHLGQRFNRSQTAAAHIVESTPQR
jgi:hypothetical protein